MEQLSSFSRQVSTHTALVQTLSGMGFNPEFIDIAIAYTGSMNVEDLLVFLIKGVNGWEHEFIRIFYLANDENRCELCKDTAEEHYNPEDLPPLNIAELHEKIKQNQQRASLRYSKELIAHNGGVCEICYEPLNDKWVLPSCSIHEFCRTCFVLHLESLIKDSKVTNITCPGKDCTSEFTQDDIKSLVSEEIFAKYLRFKERAELMIDPSVKWCIQPNCEGYIRGKERDKKKECPRCGFELCFQCGKAWHPKKSCDQIVDDDYELWAKGKEIQLCPKCKHKIEKYDGCNHMTCAACSYNWCWLCRGRYYSNHFSPYNPIGCPNLQSGYNTRSQWPLWKIYLARLRGCCLWILFIILLPLIIAFGPAVFVISRFNKENSSFWGLCTVVCDIFIFIGIVAITPPGYAIAIPVFMVYVMCKCCKQCF